MLLRLIGTRRQQRRPKSVRLGANLLKLPPDVHLGEAAGVASIPRGISTSIPRGVEGRGPAYGNTASQILGIRSQRRVPWRAVGKNSTPGFRAPTVRVDKDDNIGRPTKGSDDGGEVHAGRPRRDGIRTQSEASDTEAHPHERTANPPLPHVMAASASRPT